MDPAQSKQTWAYVALYDGKKIKKYFTPMEEFIEIDWISDKKFSFRNDNQSYCEGIVLARADDERSLRSIVSKKLPRVPYNAFKPFPDNTKRATMFEKWKKRFMTTALNDITISKKSPSREEVSVDVHPAKQPANETVNTKVENEPAHSSNQQVNNDINFQEMKPPPKNDLVNAGYHQSGDDTERQFHQSLKEVESSPKMSSENIKVPSYSRNVAEYVMANRRIPSLSDSDQDSVIDTRFFPPDQSKRAERFPVAGGMVSKKKYMKLFHKYNLLKTMFIEQREQYAKDLKIQYFAQCLYKAIKHRYSSDEEDND